MDNSISFQPPALPLYQQRPLVMFDLDDTMHEAENHIMAYTWNALLAPWNVVWRPFEGTNPKARFITEKERPGVGLKPLNVVKHFMTNIEDLDMNPKAANEDLIYKLGVKPEDLISIRERWTSMDSTEHLDEWAKLLESARNSLGVQIVKEYGIKEIPGAPDLMRAVHDADFAVGIITQGSLDYVREVVNQLGLVHRKEDGSYTADYDMLVAGDMVKDPKPNREPYDKTVELMRGLRRLNCFPIAMFGDSGSDANFALNVGIPKVFIRESEHLSPQKMQQLSESLGSRIEFVDGWQNFDVERLNELRSSVEGSRSLSKERM